MALINRISRLFKADFHAVLDRVEEPEALLKQAMRDMEDELADTEQRIALCAHDQQALAIRKTELERAFAEFDAQLDLCFESGKDELAKTQIKKKLETERVLKRVATKLSANNNHLDEQRTMLEENSATLESLRQKAELFAHRPTVHTDASLEFDDVAWMTRELTVGDDEIEIAYLREKSLRSAS
jgi:phage shock protein A